MSLWRQFTRFYATFLSWLLAFSVAILVIPVSLQIFSRYTALVPSYIWTEEMARFLFIWTIMIGAMIGVRESTHFEVDEWPRLPLGAEAPYTGRVSSSVQMAHGCARCSRRQCSNSWGLDRRKRCAAAKGSVRTKARCPALAV
jgi:Tripartite ATP-independent periplasmic transporters, DctQ component